MFSDFKKKNPYTGTLKFIFKHEHEILKRQCFSFECMKFIYHAYLCEAEI